VHIGSSGGKHTAFLDQVEVGKAVSPKGGFTCIKIGAWDDATAAKLAEQKVRVSLHTLTLYHALHTMSYTSSSFRAQRLSQQAASASFEGGKLAKQAKSHVDHGKCPRCNHTVSESAFKNNKCMKKTKFVERCNAKVRKDGPGRCRTDDAPIYRPGCCGPWPGQEMAEDEEDTKLVAKVDVGLHKFFSTAPIKE